MGLGNRDQALRRLCLWFPRRRGWKLVSENQFAIITEDERTVFKDWNLTEIILVANMVTDEIDMIIKYEMRK